MSLGKPLVITRAGAIPEEGGTRATATTLTITASIQPITSQAELDALAAIADGRDVVKVYTDTELHDNNSETPDSFPYNGTTYDVMKVFPWQNGVLKHFECVAVRAR